MEAMELDMRSAIVTGAGGFIGRWVVEKLLNENIEVYAVVRNVDNLKKVFGSNEKLYIIECDLNKVEKLSAILRGKQIDVCYHLAWQGVSGEDLKNYFIQLNNINNTMKLIELLPEWNVKKFIGAGSLHEMECLVEMEEEVPSVDFGIMYKSAKLAAHYMAKVSVCSKNIDFLWPIITNTYGVGEVSKRLVYSTIKTLQKRISPKFTDATQNYDFVYISDVASAYYLLGKYGKSCRNYVIGSGNVKPLKEYLQKLGEIINCDVELKFGAVPFNGIHLPRERFDITKLVEDTGYKPCVTFEQGIKLVDDWIKTNNVR